MGLPDTIPSDTASLLDLAEQALQSANCQREFFTDHIKELGRNARSIATETLDVLFAHRTQAEIELRRREVVSQYSSILLAFSSGMEEPLALLNRAWMDIDQSLGFYLLAAGRESEVDPESVVNLINEMSKVKDQFPDAKTAASNLSNAIQGSAGGLVGLEEPIALSSRTLERLEGEFDLGEAVLSRQIILASHLHNLLTER